MNNFISGSSFFGIVVSLLAYEAGLLVQKKIHKAIANPLLISIVLTITFLLVFHVDYSNYAVSANFLSYMLTPTTICLAVPLYRKRSLLRENPVAIFGGIISGVLVSLGSVWLLSLIFGFDHQLYVTLLPKSITTAIGIGISEEFGGITTVTAAVIILTGVLGSVIAPFICKIFHLTDPVAKGVAIGTSSHAIGTSRAMEMGEAEGAMSSLSIAVSGVITVLVVNFFAGLL